MAARRRGWAWIAALALVTLFVAAGAWRWATHRLASAGSVPLYPAMAAALDDIERRRYPRPVHRGEAIPGRFGEALEALDWSTTAARLATTPCPAGASEEDADCRAFLDSTRAPLAALLAATLRAEGGFGPGIGILAPLSSGETMEVPAFAASAVGASRVPRTTELPRAVLHVCKRAALEVDAAAARGDGAGVLQTCADTMAWARDVALGGNMIELMVTLACVRIASTACTRALPAADPAQRKELARALGIVRRGMPVLGEVARDDLTVGWLRTCGPSLDAASRARLSPVQALVGSEVERMRLSVGVPSPGPIGRARVASECREEEARTLALRAKSPSEVAATAEIEKYRVEADTVYGLIDAIVTEAGR